MKENSKPLDYHKYQWQRKELFRALAESLGVVFLLAWFFYRSIVAIFPLGMVGVVFFRELERKKCHARREELLCQFRECMLSVATSLKAGYAVENAFMESREDMKLLYGVESVIYRELELIRRGLVINITLEEQLLCLADRSGCEEIAQFAEVFSIAKRSGGNIASVMEASSHLIGQRIATKEEIQTVLGGKRMELNVMKCMPFAILLYLGISSPGYFDILYHNLQGVLIMSGCLLLYLGAYFLGESIMQKMENAVI